MAVKYTPRSTGYQYEFDTDRYLHQSESQRLYADKLLTETSDLLHSAKKDLASATRPKVDKDTMEFHDLCGCA